MTNPTYWLQVQYDIGLRRQASGVAPLALVGTSRTMSLDWGTLGGRPTINMGFSGANVTQIATYVNNLIPDDGIPYSGVKPLWGAILEAGINDVGLSQTDPATWAQFQANLSGLVTILKRATHRIALVTAAPFETAFKPDAASWNDKIDTVNGAMWLVGQAYNLPVFDANGMLRKHDKTAMPITVDGTHWNQAGAAFLRGLYEQIAAYMAQRWPG